MNFKNLIIGVDVVEGKFQAVTILFVDCYAASLFARLIALMTSSSVV